MSISVFSRFKNVVAAQSTRVGGVSAAPFSSKNMGYSSGDSEENVTKNRQIFYASLGIFEEEVAWSGQVHGKEILVAEKAGKYFGYDALITNKKNLFVAVGIADCCPVLIYDSVNNAVAAVHAGWRGTVQKIVEETILKMHAEFGTKGKNCYAYIGTCISECSFEVGEEVANEFEEKFCRFDEKRNKFFVDLKVANLAQLEKMDVPSTHIEVSPHCTVMNNDIYFSYRKEGKESGRMLAIIGMRSNH
jgi:polyphenol oxidase